MAPKSLITSIRILAALGGATMLSTGECEFIFIGVFISFFLLGMKIEKFPILSKVMAVAQPYLAGLVFTVAVCDFYFLSKSFLLSVAHFLLCLQALRLLVLKTNRENLGSILVSSMMMLSASTLAVDWTYFLLLVLFLVSLIWSLMLYTILEEGQAVSASQGRMGLQENTILWRQLMPVLRWSTGAAFGLAVSCCAVVFIIFPRFNFQGFRGQFLQPVRKTGMTGQVDLGRSGKIFTDDTPIMRIEIDPNDRANWTGYIRGQTLEDFQGRVWRKSTQAPTRAFSTARGEITLSNPDERTGDRVRQNIYLESMDSATLFAMPRAARFITTRSYLEIFPDGSVQRGNNDSWRIHYEVDSYVSQLDPGAGRKSRQKKNSRYKRTADPELQSIPENLEAVKKLAQTLVGTASTDLEKADRIAAHLRSQYQYSLDTKPTKSKSPVEGFLFESKQGHCEHFAAAMCLMLRSQGIPARMATGFLSHEWNSRGKYYLVRMRHAHAWVEADIAPYGWVGFDPSPRDSSESEGQNSFGRISEYMDYLNLRWNRYILSYDFERQVAIAKSVSQNSNQISGRLGRSVITMQKWLGSMLGMKKSFSLGQDLEGSVGLKSFGLFIGLFVFLGMVITFFFQWLKRDKQKVWFYPRLVRVIEKKAGQKIQGRTLREFTASVRIKLGDSQPQIEYLQDVYYRLRFDPLAQLTPTDSSQIQTALKKL